MHFNLETTSRWPILLASLLLFFVYIIVFLLSFNLRTGPYWHDFSSFLLMAVNPLKGMGVLYKDYWDIKPPGLFALLTGWVSLFGYEGRSFVIFPLVLECITIVSILTITWQLARKLPAFIILSVAQIPLLRSLDGEMYLSSEFIGMPFSLLGLAFLILSARRFDKISIIFAGLSGILLTFSGLIKDPFLPAAGAVIILLVTRRGYLKFLASVISSSLLILLFSFWLFYIDAWSAYLDVMNFKQNSFHIDTSIQFLSIIFLKSCALFFQLILKHQASSLIIFVLFFLVILLSARKNNLPAVAAILWIIGNIAGYIMQNKSGGHYDVQLLAPTSIGICILSLLFSENSIFFFNEKNQRILYVITRYSCLMLALLIFLSLNFHSFQKTKNRIRFSRISESLENMTEKPEKYKEWDKKSAFIDRFLAKNEPVLVVYGWDVGAYYLYLNRQPVTRYFIVNPLIMKNKQNAEFRKQFLASPPGVIVYKIKDADMDTEKFENDVLPIKNIILENYVKSSVYSHVFIRRDLYKKRERYIKEMDKFANEH